MEHLAPYNQESPSTDCDKFDSTICPGDDEIAVKIEVDYEKSSNEDETFINVTDYSVKGFDLSDNVIDEQVKECIIEYFAPYTVIF